MKPRTFPFQPKSARLLLPGDFWSIPLPDGSFACGRVVQLHERGSGLGSASLFLAGLLDWRSTVPPTELAIRGRPTVDQGQAHVCTIQRSGGVILGHRPLVDDGIEPALMLSHMCSPGVMLQRGLAVLRPASEHERASLPVFSTYGYAAMAAYAAARLPAT